MIHFEDRVAFKACIDLTVRLRVQKISSNRPDGDSLCKERGTCKQRVGTGSIGFVYPPVSNQRCPCRACGGKLSKRYWAFTVCTASHVVYDTEEAQDTKVDLFYEDESCEWDGTMKSVWAVRVMESNADSDISMMLCITHDAALADQIGVLVSRRALLSSPRSSEETTSRFLHFFFSRPRSYVLIVSHPHGKPKKISVGQLKDELLTEDDGEFAEQNIEYYTATCKGSSGAPVFLKGVDSRLYPWRAAVHNGGRERCSKQVNYSLNWIQSYQVNGM